MSDNELTQTTSLSGSLAPAQSVLDEAKDWLGDQWEIERTAAMKELTAQQRSVLMEVLLSLGDKSRSLRQIAEEFAMSRQTLYKWMQDEHKFKRAYTIHLIGQDFSEGEVRVNLRRIISKSLDQDTMNLNAGTKATELMMRSRGMLDRSDHGQSVPITVIPVNIQNMLLQQMAKEPEPDKQEPRYVETDDRSNNEEDE